MHLTMLWSVPCWRPTIHPTNFSLVYFPFLNDISLTVYLQMKICIMTLVVQVLSDKDKRKGIDLCEILPIGADGSDAPFVSK